MAEKLSELKDALSSLGISTNTPGLKGKERLEELRNRLEDALCSEEPAEPSRGGGGRGDELRSIARVVENLTSAQIRENLNLLGQNTNTPGLTGDQRREELMRRLIVAVETANMTETFVEELEARSTEPSARAKPAQPPSANPGGGATAAVMDHQDHKDQESTLGFDPECALAQQMYRLAEQRSRMIKMRVDPGPHQESKLKELEDTMLQVRAEIEFIQSKKTKDKFRKESSVLIKDGELMSVGTLLSLLSQKRLEMQEKVQDRKQKIIESENNHPVYGVAVETDIRDRLVAETRGHRNMSQLADDSMSSLRERVNSVKEKHSDVLKKPVIKEEERPLARDRRARHEEKISEAIGGQRPAPKVKAPSPLPPEEKQDPTEESVSTPRSNHSANVNTDLDRREGPSNMSEDSSSDDDGELPPLLPQPIPPKELPDDKAASDKELLPLFASDCGSDSDSNHDDDGHSVVVQRIAPPMADPPPMDGPGEGPKLSRDDSLGELSISADSKRPCAPLSMMSELATDTTFNTDFSPTAEMAAAKNGNGRPHVKGLDFKGMHINNATAAGFKEPPMTKDTEDDHHDMYGDSDEDEGGDEHTGNIAAGAEDIRRIKELRLVARNYETEGKLDESESAYLEALDIDPTDIRTLDRYAIFLHRRRGELPRAAAFFRRAIQECVPSLLRPSPDVKAEKYVADTNPAPTHSSGAFRSKVVTQVLLHYGRFLQRAQGDMDLAEDLFRKAVDVSPDDVGALGALGRFLSSDSIDPRGPLPSPTSDEMLRMNEAEELFARALRIEPENVTVLLWYAKLLKSTRKIIQAEIMYSTALKKSAPGTSHAKLEPTAICNYASFLLKYKRDSTRAEELFKDGLERYPRHKGLIRNYKHFSKVAAKKRARAPPKVPPDIAQQLAVIENIATYGDASKSEDNKDTEAAESKAQGDVDSEHPSANVDREQAIDPDDESVISAVTCEMDNNREHKSSSSNAKKVNRKNNSELLVELDGVVSIVKMTCAGIVECAEGSSAATPVDVTDSTISMTVAVKPGAWKYVKDLRLDSKGVHTSASDEDRTSNEATTVNLRSSMIVSVHQKSLSDPGRAAMLGFIVLTMTAVLGSPEVVENVYLVERAFSSERFSLDPDTREERKIKVSGKLKLHIRISINQEDTGCGSDM